MPMVFWQKENRNKKQHEIVNSPAFIQHNLVNKQSFGKVKAKNRNRAILYALASIRNEEYFIDKAILFCYKKRQNIDMLCHRLLVTFKLSYNPDFVSGFEPRLRSPHLSAPAVSQSIH